MSEQEKRDQAAQKESVSSDKKAKASKKKDAKKPNRVLRWLKDLKKVTWPSAKDVVKNVGIVIVCVLIVGACIWVFDALAHAVLEALLRLFGK